MGILPFITEKKWVIDSAASEHITNDLQDLQKVREVKPGSVFFIVGNNQYMYPTHVGTVEFDKVILLKVYYCPDCPAKLISVSSLVSKGCSISISARDGACSIIWKKEAIIKANLKGQLFYMDTKYSRLKTNRSESSIPNRGWSKEQKPNVDVSSDRSMIKQGRLSRVAEKEAHPEPAKWCRSRMSCLTKATEVPVCAVSAQDQVIPRRDESFLDNEDLMEVEQREVTEKQKEDSSDLKEDQGQIDEMSVLDRTDEKEHTGNEMDEKHDTPGSCSESEDPEDAQPTLEDYVEHNSLTMPDLPSHAKESRNPTSTGESTSIRTLKQSQSQVYVAITQDLETKEHDSQLWIDSEKEEQAGISKMGTLNCNLADMLPGAQGFGNLFVYEQQNNLNGPVLKQEARVVNKSCDQHLVTMQYPLSLKTFISKPSLGLEQGRKKSKNTHHEKNNQDLLDKKSGHDPPLQVQCGECGSYRQWCDKMSSWVACQVGCKEGSVKLQPTLTINWINGTVVDKKREDLHEAGLVPITFYHKQV